MHSWQRRNGDPPVLYPTPAAMGPRSSTIARGRRAFPSPGARAAPRRGPPRWSGRTGGTRAGVVSDAAAATPTGASWRPGCGRAIPVGGGRRSRHGRRQSAHRVGLRASALGVQRHACGFAQTVARAVFVAPSSDPRSQPLRYGGRARVGIPATLQVHRLGADAQLVAVGRLSRPRAAGLDGLAIRPGGHRAHGVSAVSAVGVSRTRRALGPPTAVAAVASAAATAASAAAWRPSSNRDRGGGGSGPLPSHGRSAREAPDFVHALVSYVHSKCALALDPPPLQSHRFILPMHL